MKGQRGGKVGRREWTPRERKGNWRRRKGVRGRGGGREETSEGNSRMKGEKK